jgi:hypothetical protein
MSREARSRKERAAVKELFAGIVSELEKSEGGYRGCKHGSDVRLVECDLCLLESKLFEVKDEHSAVAESVGVDSESGSAGEGNSRPSRAHRFFGKAARRPSAKRKN